MRKLFPKPVVDRHLALSITDLFKAQLLTEGNQFQWVWLKNQNPLVTISLILFNNSIFITGNSIQAVSVRLTYTTCNYGGTRPWFKCPACGRRVEKLYLAKRLLRCRHCHGLTYISCQTSRNHLMKMLLQSRRIKQKLFVRGLLNSKKCLVTRPKWMHSSTYRKLRNEFICSERCLSQAFYYQLDSLLKKMN